MPLARLLRWLQLPLDFWMVGIGSWFLSATTLVTLASQPLSLAVWLAVPGALLLSAVCGSSRYLVRGRALAPERRWVTLGVLGATSLVAGGVLSAVTSGVWLAAAQGPDSPRAPLVLFGSGAFFYLAAALYYAARQAENAASAAEQQSLSSSLRTREAELTALSAKVNPHFLFNSLTSIAALTTRDPEGARRMSLDLAALLRDRLGEHSEFVTLEHELETVRLYLGIERVRFAERLRVREAIQAEVLDLPVPKLILQPLVENAIKHGIAGSDDGGEVLVSAELMGTSLQLRVESPLERVGRERPAPSGQGQRLVRGRLEALYAGRASCEFAASDDRYVARLILPTELAAP
ncbi:MAG TPA: histidine kinase [Polyangiaceae bacterium]|nr:histidine kinase [Polyangiaceae bacterium]